MNFVRKMSLIQIYLEHITITYLGPKIKWHEFLMMQRKNQFMAMILSVNLGMPVNSNLFHVVTSLSHESSLPRRLNNEVSA